MSLYHQLLMFRIFIMFISISVLSAHPKLLLVRPTLDIKSQDSVLQVQLNVHNIHMKTHKEVLVELKRVSCTTTDGDSCDILPRQHLSFNLKPEGSESTLSLPGVTYNSEYHVEIRTANLHHVSQVLYFNTPECEQPDSSFTVCESDTNVTPHSTSASSKQRNFYISISICIVLCILFVCCGLYLISHNKAFHALVNRTLQANRRKERSIYKEPLYLSLPTTQLSLSANGLNYSSHEMSETFHHQTKTVSLPNLTVLGQM